MRNRRRITVLAGVATLGLAAATATVAMVTVPAAAATGTQVFNPVSPTRILDTRTTLGGHHAKLGAGQTLDLQVTSANGPVPATAGAVVVNLTAAHATTGSFLTVWPTGGQRPLASNINFGPGGALANNATVELGTGGKISIFNAVGSVDVIVDLAGFYDSTQGQAFVPVAPARILDTRTTLGGHHAKLGAGQTLDLVAAVGSVPPFASTVVVNVTVTNATAGSFLTLWPTGTPRPTTSNVNFGPGGALASNATVRLGTGGKLSIFNSVGSVDVLVDVAGYYTAVTDVNLGSALAPVSPLRVLDTRTDVGGHRAQLGAGQTLVLQPDPARTPRLVERFLTSAVVFNLTVVHATAGSFLTAWPTGTARPTVSTINFGPGGARANLAVVQTGEGGTISIFNAVGSVDVIVDVQGYFQLLPR